LCSSTLPKTNEPPENRPKPKNETIISQPPIFRARVTRSWPGNAWMVQKEIPLPDQLTAYAYFQGRLPLVSGRVGTPPRGGQEVGCYIVHRWAMLVGWSVKYDRCITL